VTALAFADDQNEYANIIEALGKAILPDGRSLSQALTFEGVPFWEVFSPELAWRHLTTAVASKTLLENAKLWIKPTALHARDLLRSLTVSRRSESGCGTWPAAPTVLCMGMTPRMYRDVLEPVAQYVATHCDCRIVVLGDAPVQFSAHKDAAVRIGGQVIWHHWEADARELAKRLALALERFRRDVAAANGLRTLLRGLDRERSAAVSKMLGMLFRCYLSQLIPQAAIALHVLTRHRPALVLSSDTSDARVRLYTLLAKRMGIPTMEVQFGLAGDESIEWRFFSADCVAVWGEEGKDALLQQKVPTTKIVQTGTPRHDALVSPPAEVISRQRSALGLTDTRPIVLLASTYVDRTHNEYARPEVLLDMKRAIFDAASKTPGMVLVVKPHPHENVEATRALAGQAANIVFVDKASDIRDFIAMSDAFVSFGSTATIDALIANKPTICPIFPGWPFSENYRASGSVWIPETREEVRRLFSRIVEEKSLTEGDEMKSARIRYLDRIVYRLDNLAASRIGQKVIKMAKLETSTFRCS
jgi:hypothetical protein